MADLESKLGAILSPGPVPTRGPDLVRYMGGRQAVTRALSGMDGPPKRGDYSPEGYAEARRTWRTAQRQAQRWDESGAEGKQRRGQQRAQLDANERRRAQSVARTRKRREIERRGLVVRIKATTRINSAGGRPDERTRVMPAGGPGLALDETTAAELIELLSEHTDMARDDAAELLREAFLEEYGLPEYTEFESVQWLKVWPVGDPEPPL